MNRKPGSYWRYGQCR